MYDIKCVECQEFIPDHNWKYCSVKCRNVAVSRYKRGTFKRINMFCKRCGQQYLIPQSRKYRSKYCSAYCWYQRNNREENIAMNDQ